MATDSEEKSVGLFATCLVDLIRPQIGFASAKLIADSGFNLDVPKQQTCCGQPLFNGGDIAGTKNIAIKVAKTFAPYDYVVAPSGSCASVLKNHYLELFADATDAVQQQIEELASKTYELTQFLSQVADIEIVAHYQQMCTYHDSCSGFRELSIYHEPRSLLSQVNELELVECKESTACCGFGGTFCVNYPEISTNIVNEKISHILATGCTTVLGGDLGCLMNIAGTLSRQGHSTQVLHIAEVLAGSVEAAGLGRS